MSWLIKGGQATWRAGPLRLRAWCRWCDAELPAGAVAEAAAWADGYFEAEPAATPTGWERV